MAEVGVFGGPEYNSSHSDKKSFGKQLASAAFDFEAWLWNVHKDGANAIWALARFVDEVQKLTDYDRGVTISMPDLATIRTVLRSNRKAYGHDQFSRSARS